MRSTVLMNLTVQSSIVNYRYNIVQQITITQSFCITEMLYLLNSNSSFPYPLHSPSNHYSALSFYVFDRFRYFILVESCSARLP